MKKKIAFVTGWYVYGGQKKMIENARIITECLFESAKKYFFPNHEVDFIFITNGKFSIDGVKNIHFDYYIDGFWEMCLMKILSLRYLEDDYDYVFVHDNDQIYIKSPSEQILETDFVFLNHWFEHSIKSIHTGVTDKVELNFNTSVGQWTMGNFFGGKMDKMKELLKMTDMENKKYFGHNYEGIGFYSRYPEELFIIKYVYESNVKHIRLNCAMNPSTTIGEFFLGEFPPSMSEFYKINNATLLHNTKMNMSDLKELFRKPKIVVCQFYTSNVSYGTYSEEINRRYCEINGYEYFVEKNGDKIKEKLNGRSWTWYKPHLIDEVFTTYQDFDYVLFLDIDAIFCNEKRRIEEFISDDFSILMTEDYGPSVVNAGVMLLKRDEFSKTYIKQWWEICEEFPQYKTGLWHDQTCIGLLNQRIDLNHKFKIIENYDFNSRGYNEDRFIFHAFSYGNLPNRTIDSIYYKKFNITTNNKDLNVLGDFHGTDKGFGHNYYERLYKKILQPKQKNCDILEICHSSNSSLLVWNEFFENGLIHGIISINNLKSENRIETFILNQSDENEIINFSQRKYTYDVIIDDGTHKMKDQQVNIQHLFQNLKPGGVYIIEDLQTSLECKMPEKSIFGWGDPSKTTTLEMIQSLIDNSPKTDYQTSQWENFLRNIEEVHLSKDNNDSIFAIIKKINNEN